MFDTLKDSGNTRRYVNTLTNKGTPLTGAYQWFTTEERNVSSKIVVGLDGSGSGSRAVAHAKKMAKLIGSCELVLVHVIEWSPYAFQTPEENEMRHKRREQEIAQAHERVVDPAVAVAKSEGFAAKGVVLHGDVADLLNKVAEDEGADQIVVARTSEGGLATRIFGSSTVNLVMHATVPVTVVS